jgi:tRNA pseudouridine55 synthase
VSDERVFGFLNIDKPLHVTSHDIVERVRRELHVRKVGHAGTLDPLATGVLVICLGPATRLSEYVMHATKHYRAHVRFGVTTTTDDAEGEILGTCAVEDLTRSQVEAVLPSFVGDIMQAPPMYSAIKVGGRKLYQIARAGQTIELKPRLVHVSRLHLVDWQPPVAVLDVMCSSGTYIRSLARDLGEALAVGAHLSGLRRTQSGNFAVDQALPIETVLTDSAWRRHIIPVKRALAGWRVVQLDEQAAGLVGHGMAVPQRGAHEHELALAFAGDALLAVVRAEGAMWVPQKVFWRDA